MATYAGYTERGRGITHGGRGCGASGYWRFTERGSFRGSRAALSLVIAAVRYGISLNTTVCT